LKIGIEEGDEESWEGAENKKNIMKKMSKTVKRRFKFEKYKREKLKDDWVIWLGISRTK
jgi:hypothetical protein